MWLRRKKITNSEIPELRDEYETLLQDALQDLTPLQQSVQAAYARTPSLGDVRPEQPQRQVRNPVVPLPLIGCGGFSLT